ncbi:hypothetical protein BTM29_01860 [Companilactobacillus allii]|uniref:Uncharacterized protein n=1 Tax=Companilactobacillus allii TaxID=1847728 RepID=A0A1P8Q0H3_9LACO|nr:hypothetical protein BTM29_01860 [Companilactobacillus allii]
MRVRDRRENVRKVAAPHHIQSYVYVGLFFLSKNTQKKNTPGEGVFLYRGLNIVIGGMRKGIMVSLIYNLYNTGLS